MTAMTKTLRNRLFLNGLIFGGVFGLVTGSIVALQFGDKRVNTVKGKMFRWVNRNKAPVDYSKIFV